MFVALTCYEANVANVGSVWQTIEPPVQASINGLVGINLPLLSKKKAWGNLGIHIVLLDVGIHIVLLLSNFRYQTWLS